MKRREFIISSLLTIGGTALLGGCTKKVQNKYKDDGSQISRKKFKDLSIPLLALGCMRLPTKYGNIDMQELDKMVAYAFEHGVNYFDTAYMYMDGKSEGAIGEVLKKYDRKSFFLASKNPTMRLKSKEDIHTIFAEQLKRCQTDYFDFYMVHNINKDTVDTYRNYDSYNELLKYKKEGKIKYLGFSFHGDPDMLKTVVKEHDWDFCQLQLNYLDWDVLQAKEMYEIATAAGLPVIVMEPLRGGGLCNLNPKAMSVLKSTCPNNTPTEYALRWVAGKENVFTVLSGMSNLEQVRENIATLSDFKPLTAQEEQSSEKLARLIQAQGEINCTGCKYCIDTCPRGVNIPAIFSLYNTYKLMGNEFLFAAGYKSLKDSEKVDRCIDCKACNKHCPQGLHIPDLLKKVGNELKSLQA